MAISFGYSSSRATDDMIPAVAPAWSGVGLCSVSEDADASKIPPNEPVRFQSTDPAFLAALGTGPLAASVAGLNDQLKGYGADLCVVRVPEGTGATPAAKLDATFANIIGDAGSKTGLWALRNAVSHVGMAPRLIDVPEFTHQQPDGDLVDNPVRAALAAHLEALKAVSIVQVDSTTKEKAIAARSLMSSERMVPMGVAARVYERAGNGLVLVNRPMSTRALGLFVQVDNANEGNPFEPIANLPILGIADINRPISYDLGDGSTEAQLMLTDDIAVVVKGQVANVGAIADGGFYFIGVESAANSDLWSQIHQIRGADFLDAQTARLVRQYLGRSLTPRRVEAFFGSVDEMLRGYVKSEDLLGFQRNFPAEINSISDVQLGEIHYETKIEPAPVLRRVFNTVRRYRPGVQALVDAIVASTGSASAVVS